MKTQNEISGFLASTFTAVVAAALAGCYYYNPGDVAETSTTDDLGEAGSMDAGSEAIGDGQTSESGSDGGTDSGTGSGTDTDSGTESDTATETESDTGPAPISCDLRTPCLDPKSFCNTFTGSCVEAVVYAVSQTDMQTINDAHGLDVDKAFSTLGEAVGGIVDDTPTIIWADEGVSFDGGLEITNGKTVLLSPAPWRGESVEWTGDMNAPVLAVSSAASVFLENVTISNSSNGNAAFALLVSGARVSAYRTRCFSEHDAIRVTNSGHLDILSSFVHSREDAVYLHGQGSGLHASYSTIVAQKDGVFNGGRVIACVSGGNLTARNSILFSDHDDADQIAGCSNDTVLTGPHTLTRDGSFSTTDVGSLFLGNSFEKVSVGDFHIRQDGDLTPFATHAVREIGDPSRDIDGDPIPLSGYPGADQPQPQP